MIDDLKRLISLCSMCPSTNWFLTTFWSVVFDEAHGFRRECQQYINKSQENMICSCLHHIATQMLHNYSYNILLETLQRPKLVTMISNRSQKARWESHSPKSHILNSFCSAKCMILMSNFPYVIFQWYDTKFTLVNSTKFYPKLFHCPWLFYDLPRVFYDWKYWNLWFFTTYILCCSKDYFISRVLKRLNFIIIKFHYYLRFGRTQPQMLLLSQ